MPSRNFGPADLEPVRSEIALFVADGERENGGSTRPYAAGPTHLIRRAILLNDAIALTEKIGPRVKPICFKVARSRPAYIHDAIGGCWARFE